MGTSEGVYTLALPPVVRIETDAANLLINTLRTTGAGLWDAQFAVGALLADAADLLVQPVIPLSFADIGLQLANDADDLEWRVNFLAATDGFDLQAYDVASRRPIRDWQSYESDAFTFEQLALLLIYARSQRELSDLLTWMLEPGIWAGNAFSRDDISAKQHVIAPEYRPIFAGAMVTAYESGWRHGDEELPTWLAAGMVAYGNLSAEDAVELGLVAFDSTDDLNDAEEPNPFGLDKEQGLFGPFADYFIANPEVGREFISVYVDEFDRTGDTPINMHEDRTQRPAQLANIIISAGTSGPVEDREAFVDRLVRTINNDDDTSGPVFWATWSAHADLALEHGIVTTEPTFDQHHLMPDFMRPTWEHQWNDRISPFVLNTTFLYVKVKKKQARLFSQATNPTRTILDWVHNTTNQTAAPRYNDPGGTYTTRAKDDFTGLPSPASSAERGRNVLVHSLVDGSDRGDIGQDEFAIINHGTGAGGRPTYTVNLPGVIDLTNPSPGWDSTHMSVRDMDMAALLSATNSNVDDNLYAQMVERALAVNGVPLGANLLVVGHSFGADTAADLASNKGFTERYNVTHVVAAAYDSVPQLANINPDIDVLVLQNEDDKAILLERTQRRSAVSRESVSINTFSHEVRAFDGGWNNDAGHHQDRYVNYLEDTNDAELTRFYESLTATGYANSGISVAIDVTLDQNLLN